MAERGRVIDRMVRLPVHKIPKLIEEQKEENRGRLAQPAYNTGHAVFDWYRESGRKARLYGKMIKRFCVPHTQSQLKKVEDRMAGEMFEELVEEVFITRVVQGTSTQFPGATVLSHERTIRVFQEFYYEPDFIVLSNTGRVVGIAEATLSSEKWYIADKLEKFNGVASNLVEHGVASSEDLPLVFLIPKKSRLEEYGSLDSRITFHRMPFTHNQFTFELRTMTESYRPYRSPEGIQAEDSATLQEVQERAREQKKKGDRYRWDARYMEYRDRFTLPAHRNNY